jgi:hypothetical protein
MRKNIRLKTSTTALFLIFIPEIIGVSKTLHYLKAKSNDKNVDTFSKMPLFLIYDVLMFYGRKVCLIFTLRYDIMITDSSRLDFKSIMDERCIMRTHIMTLRTSAYFTSPPSYPGERSAVRP